MKLSAWRFWPVIGSAWICLQTSHPTAAQMITDGKLPGNSIVTHKIKYKASARADTEEKVVN